MTNILCHGAPQSTPPEWQSISFLDWEPMRESRHAGRADNHRGHPVSQNLFPNALSHNYRSEMGKRERVRLTNGGFQAQELST
jgi:hypothetical protein